MFKLNCPLEYSVPSKSPLGNKFFDYSKKNEITDLYLQVDSITHLLNLQLDYTENLKLILNAGGDFNVSEGSGTLFSLESLHEIHSYDDIDARG